MNKRQAKKLYKKIHGCNPPEGRIPAALLRDPGKMNTHTFLDKQMNSRFRTIRKQLKESNDPVVITTRKLSENRKKNKGTAWRRARRNR